MSRNHPAIEPILDEDFDRLFDEDLQPVYGSMPATATLRTFFDRDVQFRLWKHRVAKRYLRWVHRSCKRPDSDKFFISKEFFNALDEQPDPKWLEKPQKRRKTG